MRKSKIKRTSIRHTKPKSWSQVRLVHIRHAAREPWCYSRGLFIDLTDDPKLSDCRLCRKNYEEEMR